jgi:acetyl-CoA acyltransferase
MNNRDAVIVAAARTPVGKAKKGSLATVRPDDLMALVIQELPSLRASRG